MQRALCAFVCECMNLLALCPFENPAPMGLPALFAAPVLPQLVSAPLLASVLPQHVYVCPMPWLLLRTELMLEQHMGYSDVL